MKIDSSQDVIQNLEDRGFKVRISHKRAFIDEYSGKKSTQLRFKSDISPYVEILPTGGLTTVRIDGPKKSTVVGEARCSDRDNFNHRLGVKIALSRALRTLEQNILG